MELKSGLRTNILLIKSNQVIEKRRMKEDHKLTGNIEKDRKHIRLPYIKDQPCVEIYKIE